MTTQVVGSGQKSGLDPWVFPKFDSGNLGNSVFQKAATVGFQSLVPRVTPAPSHVSPWLASRDSQRFRLEPVCPPGSQFDGAKTGCYYRFIGRIPFFFSVSMYEPIESNVLLFSYSLDFFRPGQPFQQNYQQSSGCFC